jgi:anti-sigma B factor antagonist
VKVSFREQGNTRIVDVAGAVDLDAAPLLRQHLFEALGQAPKVALNLAAISFIETSGIAVLLEALLESQRRHGQFVVFGMNTAVRDDFRIAHVAKVFQVAGPEEQALIGKSGQEAS